MNQHFGEANRTSRQQALIALLAVFMFCDGTVLPWASLCLRPANQLLKPQPSNNIDEEEVEAPKSAERRSDARCVSTYVSVCKLSSRVPQAPRSLSWGRTCNRPSPSCPVPLRC